MHRTVTLHGTLTGRTWSGFEGQLPITVDILSLAERRREHGDRPGLIEAVQAAAETESGDFQSARLTADSYIAVRHIRQRGKYTHHITERLVSASALPSLAEYVDAETFTDYGEDD